MFKPSPSAFSSFTNSAANSSRRGIEVDPAAGREWGDNDANRSVRKALNKDLEDLAELYADRSSADLFQDRPRISTPRRGC